jgi:hypothetical protein
MGFLLMAQDFSAIVLFAAALAGISAVAAEESPAVRYRAQSLTSLARCRLTVQTALFRMKQGDSGEQALDNGNGTDGDGNWPRCIADERLVANSLYQATIKVARKRTTQDALKSYHVAYLAALEGIKVSDAEIRLDYGRRQTMNDSRLTEAWARFEVEAGP